MQISNSAYMGVEVLVRLAAYETDRPCTAQALGEWTNRSMSSTETLMSRLRALSEQNFLSAESTSRSVLG